MSEHEPELAPFQQSKIKLIRNTRGVNWEISVVEGAEETELNRLRELAVSQHEALVQAYPE